jgi:hypothetical protein
MGGNRDKFSDFGFFTAWKSDLISSAQGDQNGEEIDLIGYDAATILFNIYSMASGGAQGAGDKILVLLEHGLASAVPADGASAYSLVPGSQIIGIVYGGYDSTGSTGIIGSWMSKTELVTVSTYDTLANASGALVAVGYKKDHTHRFLRLVVRNSDAASAAWACGIAILGDPNNWPVNTPVNIT